tara:strand:+ start:116 stop:328 length:213 start_codon:yes stop_codon:yes gene_type:complete
MIRKKDKAAMISALEAVRDDTAYEELKPLARQVLNYIKRLDDSMTTAKLLLDAVSREMGRGALPKESDDE